MYAPFLDVFLSLNALRRVHADNGEPRSPVEARIVVPRLGEEQHFAVVGLPLKVAPRYKL